jgi:30S ribosomal protein S31
MGKGDRRSLRGKLFRGTYGKKRPRKKSKKAAAKPNA